MRVLHVINGLKLGGAETLLFRLATRPSDIKHVIVALEGPDWYSAKFEEQGIPVHHIGMRSISGFPSGVWQLTKLIGKIQPDVVQTWLYRANAVGGAAARLAHVPVVWNIRCSTRKSLPLRAQLSAYFGGASAWLIPNFIINCSARSAKMHASIGYGAAPGTVIQNGYNPGAFTPDDSVRMKKRRELGIADDMFLIGSVTRWDPDKDIPTLLEAVRRAGANIPVRCVLIGSFLDAESPRLFNAMREAGCGDSIIPLGVQADTRDLVRAMDLHVLASRTEGFPNVVAEAMLSGTPNLVTDVGDAALIVGDTGWVVPPGQPEMLADAIEHAYREWKDQPSEWAKRRETSRQQIIDHFSLDRMAEAYREVWQAVAKGKLPQSTR